MEVENLLWELGLLDTVFSSYTMGTSGLPDIYTRSPSATGPRAEGVYI